MAQVPPAQAPHVQAPSKQEAPAKVQPAQVRPGSIPLALNDPGCEKPKKPPERINIFDLFTNKNADAKLSQYTASGQKEIPGLLEKGCPVVQAYNDDDNIKFYLQNITQACVKIASDINQDFYIRPPCKQISLLVASSDPIVKVTKPLHDVPEASTTLFAIYHPYYKEKLGITESTIELVTNSAASLFAYNSGACTVQPGLVAKKGEPPKTFVYSSHPFQARSLYFSLTLSEICSTISKCAPMSTWQLRFKCAPIMSKWQFSSTLASFLLLADYISIKLTSRVSLNLFFAAQTVEQTVEFSPDDIALLNKRLQWQITEICYVICLANVINKANTIYWWLQLIRGVSAADLYAMAHGLDIEKRY